MAEEEKKNDNRKEGQMDQDTTKSVGAASTAEDVATLRAFLNHSIDVSKIDRRSFQRDGFYVCTPETAIITGTAGKCNGDGKAAVLEMLRQDMHDVIVHRRFSTGKPPTRMDDLAKPDKASLLKCMQRFWKQEQAPTASASASTTDDAQEREQQHATIHIINLRFATCLFNTLVTSPELGKLVCHLMGWRGCRVAQDQCFIKPPRQKKAVSYHRDTPYFDMEPREVATVWIALDDTYSSSGSSTSDDHDGGTCGSLEYCVGSHTWKGAGPRAGTASQFFTKRCRDLLFSAAKKEGLVHAGRKTPRDCGEAEGEQEDEKKKRNDNGNDEEKRVQTTDATHDLSFHTVCVKAGGFSLHDGNTWHGSDANSTRTKFRRGIAIHYVHADTMFRSEQVTTTDANGVTTTKHVPLGWMWKPYFKGEQDRSLPDDVFPVVYDAAWH